MMCDDSFVKTSAKMFTRNTEIIIGSYGMGSVALFYVGLIPYLSKNNHRLLFHLWNWICCPILRRSYSLPK